MMFNFGKINESEFKFLKEIDLNNINKKSGCYIIWNTELNKYYIGQSIDLSKRLNEHFDFKNLKPLNYVLAKDFYQSKKDKTKIYKISFILHNDLDTLNDLEIYLISLYNSTDPNYGYNKTKGGSSPDIEKGKENKENLMNMLKSYKEILIKLEKEYKDIKNKEYENKRIEIAKQILELIPDYGGIYRFMEKKKK